MEEVRDSISRSSTFSDLANIAGSAALAGLIAGEGSFGTTQLKPRVDGTPRFRFRFQITMADRDLDLVTSLQHLLGSGSICLRPPQREGWLPTATLSVSGRKSIRDTIIPFCDAYLMHGAKRTQYLLWRQRFQDYEARFPSNWRAGPSSCSMPGCEKPVRGRGLCRAHYYRETGY